MTTDQPVPGSATRHQAPLRAHVGRFVAVGAGAAVVDFGVLVALMSLGLGHTPAKAISFVAGTAVAYWGNLRWTFKARHSTRRLAAIVVLYLVTFATQVGLFAILFIPLERWHGLRFAQVVGFVIAQGVATAINFVVQRWWIFAGPDR